MYKLPAPVALGTSYVTTASVGAAFIDLLSTYQWTTPWLLIDLGSPFVYGSIALAMLDIRTTPPIHIVVRRILAKAVPNFQDILTEFRVESRGEPANWIVEFRFSLLPLNLARTDKSSLSYSHQICLLILYYSDGVSGEGWASPSTVGKSP